MLVPATATSHTERVADERPPPSFEELYGEHFSFVWRTLWRLGVASGSLADATQDVFVVIHRRLGDLHGRQVAKSWVYGIVVRIAQDYRRALRRRGVSSAAEPDQLADSRTLDAHARLELGEALAIAELLGANVNTVYTRLRAARADFERALARHRARALRRP